MHRIRLIGGLHTFSRLALRRGGLVVFIHPITDNDLPGHRARAMWAGAVGPLDLPVLDNGAGSFDL